MFKTTTCLTEFSVSSIYYYIMADFSNILATRPDFNDSDREWLHHLVADWQVIADLSFADLLLIIQNGDGDYVVAEQCRPSTAITLRTDDLLGKKLDDSLVPALNEAMKSETSFHSST